MRALWSLPKAAPALLRHIAAYVELVGLDLARAQKEIARSLVISVVAGLCVLLALLFGCFALIAYYWDSPYRVTAILSIGGVFALAAVLLFVYRASLARARSVFLGDVTQQWHEDRILLERILSPGDEEQP